MGKTNNAKFRPESRDNLVYNSAFDFWQEGTSFPNAANGTYYSDLIQYSKSGAMVHTISRSTDVPTNSIAKYSLDSTITTVDTSIAAGEFALLGYQMEGNDLQKIKGKRFTLSFKVKATKVGTYCVAFRNSASNRSYVAEYTINASNTWEYKEIVIQHDTTGAWNYDTNLGMYVTWALAMGSNLQAPSAGSWQSGSYFATANQVNSCDFVSNSFRITEIKINAGVGAGDYCRAGQDLLEELSKIERYFEKSYDYDVNPGTVLDAGARFCSAALTFSNSVLTYTDFRTTKRAAPQVIPYSNATGTANRIRISTTAIDRVVTTSAVTRSTFWLGYNSADNGGNNLADGSVYIYHYTANARF